MEWLMPTPLSPESLGMAWLRSAVWLSTDKLNLREEWVRWHCAAIRANGPFHTEEDITYLGETCLHVGKWKGHKADSPDKKVSLRQLVLKRRHLMIQPLFLLLWYRHQWLLVRELWEARIRSCRLFLLASSLCAGPALSQSPCHTTDLVRHNVQTPTVGTGFSPAPLPSQKNPLLIKVNHRFHQNKQKKGGNGGFSGQRKRDRGFFIAY